MRPRWTLLLIVVLVLASACSGDDDVADGSEDPGIGQGSGEDALVVAAPPGLDPLVSTLVDAYNQGQPEVEAAVEVGERAPLVAAIEAGDSDVAILPSNWLQDVEGVDGTEIGADRFVIVVPEGNPADVADLSTFAADGELATLGCSPTNNVGNFASILLRREEVQPDPERVQFDCAQDAVDQVADGSLDAALVFRGGVDLPDGVEVVDVSDDANFVVQISYVATNDDAPTEAFVTFLGSEETSTLLSDLGYRD